MDHDPFVCMQASPNADHQERGAVRWVVDFWHVWTALFFLGYCMEDAKCDRLYLHRCGGDHTWNLICLIRDGTGLPRRINAGQILLRKYKRWVVLFKLIHGMKIVTGCSYSAAISEDSDVKPGSSIYWREGEAECQIWKFLRCIHTYMLSFCTPNVLNRLMGKKASPGRRCLSACTSSSTATLI